MRIKSLTKMDVEEKQTDRKKKGNLMKNNKRTKRNDTKSIAPGRLTKSQPIMKSLTTYH